MTERPAPSSSPLRRVSRLEFAREFVRAWGNVFRLVIAIRQRYGNHVWLPFGLQAYLITDPADLRHVLVANAANYEKGGALVTAKLLLGEGLLTSEKNHHHQHRRMMQPMFHRQKIQSFAETILACTNHRAGQWRDGEVRDMSLEVTHITSSVISTALFSIDLEHEAHELSEAIVVAQQCIVNKIRMLVPLPFFAAANERRYQAAVDRINRSLHTILVERSAPGAPVKNDLLNMLMEIRYENGEGMDEKELRDEVITLFVAGHETSANTMAWALYLLSQNPAAEAKLHQELDTVLAGRDPTLADLPQLPYTEGVMWEAMRLFPPVWILGREPLQEDVLPSGVRIETPSQVLMPTWAMHRDPRVFPDPEKFEPERFREKIGLAQGYLPFGAGVRSCVGEPFAKMEIVLMLATLCQRFRFILEPGQKVRPYVLLLLRPERGIRMRIERRGRP